jgi:hypothetical protein
LRASTHSAAALEVRADWGVVAVVEAAAVEVAKGVGLVATS